MSFGFNFMKLEDLFLKGDELISFLGVAGNGDAGDGNLDFPLRLNRSADDGVVAKDLLDFVGIGSFPADADAGIMVVGKFRATKAESVGRLANQG